jgi:hypothetical protein
MSNKKNIVIDPITEEEFHNVAMEAFDTFVDALPDTDFSRLSYQDIAELFFYNGFYRGCMAMTDNADLQETIHMMNKEINYQRKQ